MAVTLGPVAATAQEPASNSELRTRQLWDTTLLSKRPPSKSTSVAKKTLAPAAGVKGSLMGVTIWRLRPSKSSDAPEIRSLIHEDEKDQEWTPERIAADTPLVEGHKVRVSVEAAEKGYLYVVDRDEYADGTKGPAYLIFPTLRTRGGDNRVSAGVLVEIPAADDHPPYLKVQRSRSDRSGSEQTSEVLTILVSPQPLSGLSIGRNRQKVSDEQVATWEKQWKARVHSLEAQGQSGKAYTVAEKQAALGVQVLASGDPTPQTMYNLDSKPGAPLLLELRLKIEK